MSALYSEQLYIAHNINTGSFTVPAGFVFILRDISFFAAGPVAGGTVQLIDRDYDCTFWWSPIGPSSAGAYVSTPDRRIVRPEGSTTDILIDAGLSEGADVLICGYALSLP